MRGRPCFHDIVQTVGSSCAPQLPIQRAVLDRLRHVRGLDVGVAPKVGDGAGDLQQAVVGAGRQTEWKFRQLASVRGSPLEVPQAPLAT